MKNPCKPKSTSAAKLYPSGPFKPHSTMASDAGASGRSYTSGKFPRNPKQKDFPGGKSTTYRNTTGPGDPGN